MMDARSSTTDSAMGRRAWRLHLSEVSLPPYQTHRNLRPKSPQDL